MITHLFRPFTTVVTARPARYFSFYCWAIDWCTKKHARGTKEQFWRDFFRLETAFLCSVYLHSQSGHAYSFTGAIGVDGAASHLAKSGDSVAVDQRIRNGWEANYKSPMQVYDLYEISTETLGTVVLRDNGLRLAANFEESIRETDYYKHCLNSISIPKAVLSNFATAACPCLLKKGEGAIALERKALRSVLVKPSKSNATPFDPEGLRTLETSLNLLLLGMHSMHTKGIRLTHGRWRTLTMFGGIVHDGRWVELTCAASHLPVLARWRWFQFQSVLVYCLEASLAEFLRWLSTRTEASRESEVECWALGSVQKGLTEICADLGAQVPDIKQLSVRDLVSVLVPDWQSLAAIEESNKEKLSRRYSLLVERHHAATQAQHAGGVLASSYALFLYIVGVFHQVYKNTPDDAIGFYQSTASWDGDEVSLPKLVETVYMDMDQSKKAVLTDFWDSFFLLLVKSRQLRTRANRGKEVAWFSVLRELSADEDFIQWENDYVPNEFRGPREPVAIGMLVNLDLVEETEEGWGLTQAGADYCMRLLT